jgi:hypothetical protein
MRIAGLAVLLAAVTLGSGCGEREVRAESGRAAVVDVVDSSTPIDVALERFRRDLHRPTELSGGAKSREALVRQFVAALETSDTAALRQMLLQRDEFAWLYYPSTAFTKSPYELPPDLLWFQTQGQSDKGASLLLFDRAGAPLGYLGHDCDLQRDEGENTIHGHCVVRRGTEAGDTVQDRLFGLIVERGGVYKFVSYANKLD